MSAIDYTLEILTKFNYAKRLFAGRIGGNESGRFPLHTLFQISMNGLAGESVEIGKLNSAQRDDFAMLLALRMGREYSPLGTVEDNSLLTWAEGNFELDIPENILPLVMVANAAINGIHSYYVSPNSGSEKEIREAGLRAMIFLAGAHRRLIPEFLKVAQKIAFTVDDYKDNESVRAGVFGNFIPELLKLGPSHAIQELSNRTLEFATKPGELSPILRAASLDCEAAIVSHNPAVATDVKERLTEEFIHYETEVVIRSARRCAAEAERSSKMGARIARTGRRLWAFPGV